MLKTGKLGKNRKKLTTTKNKEINTQKAGIYPTIRTRKVRSS